MAKKLTKNQKYVLYGLTKYPLLNDRELATIIDVEKSTIAKARKVLFDRKFFSTVRIPLSYSLGCELFSAMYTGYRSSLLTKKIVDKFIEVNRKFPESVLSVADQHLAFNFYISRNYSDIKNIFHNYETLAAKSGGFRREDVSYIIFSFKRAQFLKMFDFSSLLNKEFDLGFPEENKKRFTPSAKQLETQRLSKSEKTVLYALTRYPDDTDTAISAKFNVSRQLISRCRMDFEGRLMQTVRVADLSKIGFNRMTLTHMVVEPNVPKKTLEKDFEEIINNPHLIFGMTEDNQTLLVQAFKDQEESYKQEITRILTDYREKHYILEEPRTLFIDLRTRKLPISFEFYKILEVLYGKDLKLKKAGRRKV